MLTFFGPEYHPDYQGPGGRKVPGHVYTDNAEEYKSALEGLRWIAEKSTPQHSATNGIAERAIRRVREGTAVMLVQSHLDPSWWPEAAQTFCFLSVVKDVLHPDNKTEYARRWGSLMKAQRSLPVQQSTLGRLLRLIVGSLMPWETNPFKVSSQAITRRLVDSGLGTCMFAP